MNRKKVNNSGSTVLAVIVSMVVIMYATALIVKLTNERINLVKEEKNLLQVGYDKDTDYEVIENLIDQQIRNKEYQQQMGNPILNNSDGIEITNKLKEIMTKMKRNETYIVEMKETAQKVQDLCQEKQQGLYNCTTDKINFEITVKELNNDIRTFKGMGLKLYVEQQSGKIKANMEELEMNVSK